MPNHVFTLNKYRTKSVDHASLFGGTALAHYPRDMESPEYTNCMPADEYYAARVSVTERSNSINFTCLYLSQLSFNVVACKVQITQLNHRFFDQIYTLDCRKVYDTKTPEKGAQKIGTTAIGLFYNRDTLDDVVLCSFNDTNAVVSASVNAPEMKFCECHCTHRPIELENENIIFTEPYDKCLLTKWGPAHLINIKNQPWTTTQSVYRQLPDVFTNDFNNIVFCCANKKKTPRIEVHGPH